METPLCVVNAFTLTELFSSPFAELFCNCCARAVACVDSGPSVFPKKKKKPVWKPLVLKVLNDALNVLHYNANFCHYF